MEKVFTKTREVCKPELEKAVIVVCTGGYTISGYANCCYGQRLLDVLNEGVVQISSRNRTEKDFLSLRQFQVAAVEGIEVRNPPNCIIAKPGIAFVCEKEGIPPPASANGVGPSTRRYNEKKALAVEVYVSPYWISGRLYVEKWEPLLVALDRPDVRFLPMTHATIRPELATGDSELQFVAINRAHIIQITEV